MNRFLKSLKSVFLYGPRLISRYFRKARRGILRKIRVKQKLKSVVKKGQKDVESFVKKKEKSKSDYYKIGKSYISKRFVFIFVALIIIIPILFYTFIYPIMDGKWWQATVKVNSKKMSNFSGRAKVVDDAGNILCEGNLINGKIEGFARIFENDKLLYEGEFKNNMYDGLGILYNSDTGEPIYNGEFVKNEFSGMGNYYFDDDQYYVGEFDKSKFAGDGYLYGNYKNGEQNLLYQGNFKDNLYNGEGKLYLDDGSLLYEGEFKDGLFSGNGKLMYDYAQMPKYEGEFKQGIFSGKGILYDESTKVIYEGEFVNGFINYLRYMNEDINIFRKDFGQEDTDILLENSFVSIYDSAGIILECNYMSQDEDFIKIKTLAITRQGDGLEGVKIGESIVLSKSVHISSENISENIYNALMEKFNNKSNVNFYKVTTELNDYIVCTDNITILAVILQ